MFVLLSTEVAVVWSIVAGYLLLPSSFSVDVVGLPPIDKKSVTIISTFFLCLLTNHRTRRRPIGILMLTLAIAYVISPFATSVDNSYELQVGGLSHPGFYFSDAFKRSSLNLIDLFGFFIGWRALSADTGRATLLKALVLAALAYSVPILFEVRFSPQLHRWVYGFFPHVFGQQMRWGGFRAVVFLQHGLQVALFVVMAVAACCVAARLRYSLLTVSAKIALPYLWVILLLCKSLGTILYGLALTPLALLSSFRIWVKVASAMLLLVCAYPALRSANLIPVEFMTRSANEISTDRGGSLGTRISNENQLLKKAEEKPAFGWGGWGRNRVFDPDTGGDVSITDGGWIILFGSFGWLGYLSLLGLFTVPVLRLNIIGRGTMGADELVAGGLSLVLTANIVDMLPNDNITAITYLIAGSLAGYRHPTKDSVTVTRARQPATPFAPGNYKEVRRHEKIVVAADRSG